MNITRYTTGETIDENMAKAYYKENNIKDKSLFYINYKNLDFGCINENKDIHNDTILAIKTLLICMSKTLNTQQDAKTFEKGNQLLKMIIKPYTIDYYFNIIVLY